MKITIAVVVGVICFAAGALGALSMPSAAAQAKAAEEAGHVCVVPGNEPEHFSIVVVQGDRVYVVPYRPLNGKAPDPQPFVTLKK